MTSWSARKHTAAPPRSAPRYHELMVIVETITKRQPSRRCLRSKASRPNTKHNRWNENYRRSIQRRIVRYSSAAALLTEMRPIEWYCSSRFLPLSLISYAVRCAYRLVYCRDAVWINDILMQLGGCLASCLAVASSLSDTWRLIIVYSASLLFQHCACRLREMSNYWLSAVWYTRNTPLSSSWIHS